MPLLEVKDIVSGYGDIEVLRGVSMNVEKGELTCVIGPNGSGKSTLLKTIVGAVKPRRGKIILEQTNITGLRPDIVLKKGVAMVPQGRVVFPYMTVLENLEMGAYTIRKNSNLLRERLEYVYSLFPRLKEKQKQLAYTLSGGEQMMLCLGRSLMVRPKILMLDEPSLGLAPKYVESVFNMIKEINEEGMTMIVVEQNVRKAMSVANYVYILDLGKNKFQGTVEDFLSDDRLVKLYMGLR
jgi:branched-chain amino acid transport system ATP-binding protein